MCNVFQASAILRGVLVQFALIRGSGRKEHISMLPQQVFSCCNFSIETDSLMHQIEKDLASVLLHSTAALAGGQARECGGGIGCGT